MKKFLSVLLVVTMLFTTAVPAFAQQPAVQEAVVSEQTATDDTLPFVLVRGMDFTSLYLDYGTEKQHSAMGDVSAGSVIKALFKALIAKIFNLKGGAIQVIIDFVNDLLGKYACDTDGSSLYDIDYPTFPESMEHYKGFDVGGSNEYGIVHTSIETFGAKNTYYFTYDWRMNPLDVADEINAMINKALAETGKNKVNLACASMGGVMTVAYFTKYGYEKVNKCVFLSSTFCGTYVTTDLFQGDVKITKDGLVAICKKLATDNPSLSTLITVLDKTGLFSRLADFLADFVANNKDAAYEKVLEPIFGRDLSFWALVQPEEIDTCIDFMFSGEEDKYASLISDIYELREMMRARDNLIFEASENGVDIAVVATYDSPLIPVYKHSYVNGDMTLETYYMSGRAMVADYGKTLPESYVPAKPQYVSPDKVIDASTCLLPDYTWLIKGAPHVSCTYGTDYSKFLFWILTFDGRASITSSAQYPQFMVSGSDQSLKLF